MINIDPEFESLIPPLSPEEYAGLEASLLAHGCRTSLDVWGGIIVDGHNRFAICKKHGLPFETKQIEFVSRDAAMLWMYRHQRDRRNWSTQTAIRMGLKMKPYLEAEMLVRIKATQFGSVASPNSDEPQRTDELIAKEAGCGKTTVRAYEKVLTQGTPELIAACDAGKVSISAAAELTALPPEEQIQVVANDEVSIKAAAKAIKAAAAAEKKAARAAEIAAIKDKIANEGITPLDGLFDVIAIDPPWNYGREYDPDTSRVANPYPEMKQSELLNIVLPAKPDAVLFLWTTHAFLWDAKALMDHWGFDYKATMVWDKKALGMGHWLRMQCEFCLVGIKGKPEFHNQTERDIISESRREHSRKPEAFYTLVEKVTTGRRLDYFARAPRVGWVTYGAEDTKYELAG